MTPFYCIVQTTYPRQDCLRPSGYGNVFILSQPFPLVLSSNISHDQSFLFCMLSLALGCSFGCDYKARVELSSDLGTVTRTSGSGTESTVSSAGSNVGMNKRMWVYAFITNLLFIGLEVSFPNWESRMDACCISFS